MNVHQDLEKIMVVCYVELVKKNLKKEPKLFHVKVVKSSLGVKAAKMGVLL